MIITFSRSVAVIMINSTEVSSAVENILRKCNIDTNNIDVENITSKGDGYMGLVWSAKVITGNDKLLHLIVKVAINTPEFRDLVPVEFFFRREAYIYETVFPAFKKLQIEIGIKKPFTNYAKFYGSVLTIGKEILVMEDLKERGFRLWDRLTPMDGTHLSRVMQEYGRYHALSFMLRDKKPNEFKRVTRSIDDVFVNLITPDVLLMYESACINVAKMLESGGNDRAAEKVKDIKNEVADILTNYAKKDDDYSVLLHGDCWCNNMMFKYEENEGSSKLSDMCFIDWQISRLGSPVLDLLYYFFMCASSTELQRLDKYLKKYHDSLSSFLEEGGCDPDALFPFEVLTRHVKNYCKYGFLWTLVVLRITLTDKDETPEMSKDGMDKALNGLIRRQNMYDARITDLVLYLIDNALI